MRYREKISKSIAVKEINSIFKKSVSPKFERMIKSKRERDTFFNHSTISPMANMNKNKETIFVFGFPMEQMTKKN